MNSSSPLLSYLIAGVIGTSLFFAPAPAAAAGWGPSATIQQQSENLSLLIGTWYGDGSNKRGHGNEAHTMKIRADGTFRFSRNGVTVVGRVKALGGQRYELQYIGEGDRRLLLHDGLLTMYSEQMPGLEFYFIRERDGNAVAEQRPAETPPDAGEAEKPAPETVADETAATPPVESSTQGAQPSSEAEVTATAADESAPPDDYEAADKLYRKGVALQERKLWKEAEQAFRESLKLQPGNADTMSALGETLRKLSSGLISDHESGGGTDGLKEASALLKEAAELKPGDPQINKDLGSVLFKLGELDDAQSKLEEATALAPDDPALLEMLGDVLKEQAMRQKDVNRAHEMGQMALTRWKEAASFLHDKDRKKTLEEKVKSLGSKLKSIPTDIIPLRPSQIIPFP